MELTYQKKGTFTSSQGPRNFPSEINMALRQKVEHGHHHLQNVFYRGIDQVEEVCAPFVSMKHASGI
jgi:hypothetical protein